MKSEDIKMTPDRWESLFRTYIDDNNLNMTVDELYDELTVGHLHEAGPMLIEEIEGKHFLILHQQRHIDEFDAWCKSRNEDRS
jgi:hypothetical protein